MSDEQHKPLPQRELVIPDYRGVLVGEAPRCRDPKNAKRVTPRGAGSYIEPGAGDRYWGID
jgi:hypothetical protein